MASKHFIYVSTLSRLFWSNGKETRNSVRKSWLWTIHFSMEVPWSNLQVPVRLSVHHNY